MTHRTSTQHEVFALVEEGKVTRVTIDVFDLEPGQVPTARQLGLNPRALGTNPRALGTNPNSIRDLLKKFL